MDPFDRLREEHRQVLSMVEEMLSTTDVDWARETYAGMTVDLLAHMEGEERALYTELLGFEASKTMALRSFEEHRIVRVVLEGLRDHVGTDEGRARGMVLRSLIEQHAEREEGEVFPRAQELLDPDGIARIADQLEQAEQSARVRAL